MASVVPEIGKIVGHYRLLEKIGAGGMGVVYRAHDERLDRDVALKVLSPDGFADENARKMFRQEALTISQLSHGNIASVFDFDTHEGLDFLVMEYVRGTTLAERLTKGPLQQKEVLGLGAQIVSALEEAHHNGVIHCDLKPGNIMVTASHYQVKLLDFGLAKMLRISGTAITETADNLCTFWGTLPYMSPEQLLGKVPDFRSDIYSVGAILYEMATARRPFEEKLPTALTEEILHKLPAFPAFVNTSISPSVQGVILKCLEKDPDDRYQSLKELAVDLRRMAAPRLPVEIVKLEAAPRQKLRNKLIVITVAIAGLLGCIGLASRYLSGKPRKSQVVLMGDFNNRTDQKVLDDIIPELLTISLEQSGYISVFPSSRRLETLSLMGLGPATSINEATGREICQREALDAVILGSITKLGDRYVVTARALSPSGQSLASTEDVLDNAGDLPGSLDKISIYLRNHLGESKSEIRGSSVPVADVTSSSLPAIQSFLVGKKQLYEGSPQDAKIAFEKALELDPSFAMAQEYLGLAYLHQGNPMRAEEELRKTLPMLKHVTEQEKQKILGDYNLLRRDFDQAIVHFRLLKTLRPKDPAPSLNLAQCYEGKLRFNSALEETKAALEIESAAGPRNNLAEIYLLLGDIPSALKTAAEIVHKSDKNVRGLENLGWAYLLNGQQKEARDTFELMIRLGGDAESRGRSALADMAMSSGRYSEAKRQLVSGSEVDRQLGNLFAAEKKQIALLSVLPEEPGSPLFRQSERDLSRGDPTLIFLEGLSYARMKRRTDLKRKYDSLDAEVKNNPVPTLQSFREMLSAEMALLDANPGAAVPAAKKAVELEDSTIAWQVLAESYAAAQQPKAAILSYERVLARGAERSQSYDAPAYHTLVDIHYRVGALCQDSGEISKAREHLEQFLKSWSDPDGNSTIYSDAKARFRRLSTARAGTGIPAPPM
jgi:serine/threonine protein kinase/tetratricopeptide (TPR) repeat protein